MAFKRGDVVRIRTDGPEMVVESDQSGDEVRLAWTYQEGDEQVTEHLAASSRILVGVISNDPGVRNSMEPDEVYHTIAELTSDLPKLPGQH